MDAMRASLADVEEALLALRSLRASQAESFAILNRL